MTCVSVQTGCRRHFGLMSSYAQTGASIRTGAFADLGASQSSVGARREEPESGCQCCLYF